MATPQENLARFQEIANRGLQDNLDPAKRARFDEAIRRNLISAAPQQQPVTAGGQQIGAGDAINDIGRGDSGLPSADGVQVGIDPTAAVFEPAGAIVGGIGTQIVSGLAGGAALPFVGAERAAEITTGIQQKGAEIFAPKTEAGRAGLQTVGDFINAGIDITNFPISGLAGIAELVTGQGVEQAAATVEEVQERGITEVAGERTLEATGSPLAATAVFSTPELVASLIPLIKAGTQATTTIRNIAKSTPDGTQRSILKAAEQANVPILTTDLFPPKSYMGRLAQSLSEKLGPLGTGSKRTAQQSARVDAVVGLADELDIDLDTPFADDIVKSLKAKNARELQSAGLQRTKAIDSLDEFGKFDAPKTISKIDELVAKENALGATANKTVINELEKFREELINPSDFGSKAAQRTQMIKLRNTLGRGDDAAPPAAVQQVKSSLDKDMLDFARANDKTATKNWLGSNRKFANEADISKRTTIKQILEKGDITPEKVLPQLKGGRPSELKRLKAQLGPKGQEAARRALLQQALKDAKFFELGIEANPNTIATALNKPNFQQASKVFFEGDSKKELDGLVRMLNATRKAQEGQLVLRTGEQASVLTAGIGIGAAAALEPIIAIPATLLASGLIKAYESKPFRNILIKLNNAKPGTKAELNFIEKAAPFILAGSRQVEEE